MRKIIPTIVAILVLLLTPFNYVPLCGSKSPTGLVCYCCINTGKTCTMISCSGCKAPNGLNDFRLAPEMILQSSGLFVHFIPVYLETESLPRPEIVFIEVPVRPPIIV